MSIFYMDPRTGALYAESRPARGVVQLPGDFTVGVSAPVVIECAVHGRFEAHMSVVGLGHRGRNALGPHTFARCALAAAAGNCRQYHAWKVGLGEDITRILQRASQISWPAQSWRALGAAVSRRVDFMKAVRALAAMALPQPPRAVLGVNYALDRSSGAITTVLGAQYPAECSRLPCTDGGWLIARCREHGWELYDEVAALSGHAATALTNDLAVVMLADGARSCDELNQRLRQLDRFLADSDVSLSASVTGTGLGTLQLARSLADIIAKASGDTGWLVAQALAELADG